MGKVTLWLALSLLLLNSVFAGETTTSSLFQFNSTIVTADSTFQLHRAVAIEVIPGTSIVSAVWEATTAATEWGIKSAQVLLGAVSNDGGQTWGTPTIVFNSSTGMPVWEPQLLYSTEQKLMMLFFSQSTSFEHQTADTYASGGDIFMIAASIDALTQWSAPVLVLPAEAKGGNITKHVGGRPVFLTLDQQQWVIPYYQGDGNGPLHGSCAGLILTTTQGQTYQSATCFDGIGMVGDVFTTSSVMVADENYGKSSFLPQRGAYGATDKGVRLVQIFFAVTSTVSGRLYMLTSTDGGATWSSVKALLIDTSASSVAAADRVSSSGEIGYEKFLIFGSSSSTLLLYRSQIAPSPWNYTSAGWNFTSFNTLFSTSGTASGPSLVAIPSSQYSWGVAFTENSKTIHFATFDTAQAAEKEYPQAAAIAITFGIIGGLTVLLYLNVVLGYLRAKKQNPTLLDDLPSSMKTSPVEN